METIQALREHVESSQNFENASQFLEILDKVSAHVQNQQSNQGINVVRCINIEGKTLIQK
jgi:hypothetical protein